MSNLTVPGLPPLAELDADGAIRETAAAVDGDTREAFLRKAGVLGGSLLAGGAFLGAAPPLSLGKSRLHRRDVHILRFALTLEYLEAAFYVEAKGNGLGGEVQTLAELLADHETTHVETLQKVLGPKSIKSPKFDFGDTTDDKTKFLKTSFALENTGVHAYLGQAGRIRSKEILQAAATIVTVEARHAAAVALVAKRGLKGEDGITPDDAFDVPFSKAEVLKVLEDTGFIVG